MDHPALQVRAETYRRQVRLVSTASSADIQRFLAKEDTLAAAVQTRVAAHPYVRVRQALGCRRDLLPRTQRILAADESPWVRTMLLSNPAVTDAVRIQVLSGPVLRFQFLAKTLIQTTNPEVLEAAYRHAIAHEEVSPPGARSVLFRLVNLPQTPRSILRDLVGRAQGDSGLSGVLAQREDLLEEEMETLWASGSRHTLRLLAANPATPLPLLWKLPASSIPRERIWEVLKDPEALDLSSGWSGTLQELKEVLDLVRT